MLRGYMLLCKTRSKVSAFGAIRAKNIKMTKLFYQQILNVRVLFKDKYY